MRTRYEVELLKKLCSCMGGSSRKVSGHEHAERAQAVYAAGHEVAAHHRAHAFGVPV